jgi:hypothetical protein
MPAFDIAWRHTMRVLVLFAALKDAAGAPVVDRPDLGGLGTCQLTVGP